MLDQNKIFDMYIELEDIAIELEDRGADDIYLKRLRLLRDDIKHIYVNNFIWEGNKNYG
jgi:hypothetical protein